KLMNGSDNCQEIDLRDRCPNHTLSRDAEPPKRTWKGGRMVRRRFQYGALYKRGTRNKGWVGRWWEDEVGPSGESRRIRRGAIIGTVAELPTRRLAEQMLVKHLQDVNNGNHRIHANRTFLEFAEQTWMPEVLPTVKYSTQKHYEYVIRVHLAAAFGST